MTGRKPVHCPADPAELRAAAHGAVLNHAARLLHMTGSPLARDIGRAVLRVRDAVCPLTDASDADTLPADRRGEVQRVARLPALELVDTDCGPLAGVLMLPAAPVNNAWLRPLRRYHAEALRLVRGATDAVDALMALDALRVEFHFDAEFYAWRRLSVSAGACAAVEILLLRLSSALGRAVETTATSKE